MLQFFRSNTILKTATLIGIGGFSSRLLGLLRDRLLAGNFGAGRDLDIYYAAFRLPDFIYSILILGAISAVFIPIFASLETKEEKNTFASSALNIIIILIGGIALILFLFTPFLIRIIAPGFNLEDRTVTVFLTRIMLLQPILLAISNTITSILQGFNRFFATAIAPSFYNLGIIIGILLFVPIFGLKGLAYGVVLGSLLHLAIQLPALSRAGFSWQPIVTITKDIKKLFLLMGPRVLGIASDQINLIVITAVASTLSLGSISIFNLAQNIQATPVGIIGIAIATAVFPTLSFAYWRNGNNSRQDQNVKKEEFSKTFCQAFRLVLFFSIPLSILFILLRAQIVRVILGSGLFNWQDTRLTAAALGIFGLSVFAQSLIPLLAKAFYSMHNTKTPVFIGILMMGVNITLALLFVKLLAFQTPFYQYMVGILKLTNISDIRIIALPLAFSLTAIVEFMLLFFFLFFHIDAEYIASMNLSWLKLVGATTVMAGITYLSLRPLAKLFDMTTGIGVFMQGLGAGIAGMIVYFLITYILKENPLAQNAKRKI